MAGQMDTLQFTVAGLATATDHGFSKQPCDTLLLHGGIGVVGDAHAGAQVRHRSRVARDPSQPNLRQVHLIDTGFVAMLAALGFAIGIGDIGENILLDGDALIDLPVGTTLTIGDAGAVLAVTGLRNPCRQLDAFQPGLMHACLGTHADGSLCRLSGVMAVVIAGGPIHVGDGVGVALPALPHRPLGPV